MTTLLLIHSAAFAQQLVRGTITDAAGAPIPGVSVVIKGSTAGTTSITDGTYSLTVPDSKAALIFSFIGYSRKSR